MTSGTPSDKFPRGQQLPLRLPLRPALSGEDFLVAEANAAAVAWIDRWPQWPAPAVAIFGSPGCGKSHLAQVFLAHSAGVMLAADELAAEDPLSLFRRVRACVIEADDATLDEIGLFHLYNAAEQSGGSLLLTSQHPPARWSVALPDLTTRLTAVPCVAIDPPDEALISALLVKLFADRQLRVAPEVVGFLTPRLERSFDSARQIVAALDEASLDERRAITVPLARRVLDSVQPT